MRKLERASVLTALAVASIVIWTVAPGASGVSAEDCCFANTRFSGTCRVTPGAEESCSSVLAYLNNPMSAGRSYCGTSRIRGGWQQVACPESAGAIGAPPTHQARPADIYSAPGWSQLPSSATPSSPQMLEVTPGSVIKVRMDDTVDLQKAPAGTSFAARLDADLVVDGAVAAPSGSPVYGRVVQAQGEGGTVLELTDVSVDDQLVPVVADAATLAAVGLPVPARTKVLASGQVAEVDPTVALFLTGDVAGAMDLTRATIAVRRQEIVGAALELTPEEGEAFWPLYREYRAALDGISAREANVIVEYAAEYDRLSDGTARALLDAATAAEADRVKLKQRYVKRFAKVLPGVKLARYFQVESKLDAVIRMELAAGIPLAR